ncbi:hypothetical protein H8E07_21635 [bacterium]|nr:hypothetical protein [bacterium]
MVDKKKRRRRRGASKPGPTNGDSKPTLIWGPEVESGDYIKVPRALLRLPHYLTSEDLCGLKPRHLLLFLALASHKYKNQPIRVYWQELADDLGVEKDTVRKWAYEVQEKGLLRMKQHRGRDPEKNRVGHRNERNSFDIAPFVRLVEKVYKMRALDRQKRKQEADRES